MAPLGHAEINNIFTDNVEDFGIVVPICNLLEYSDNYSLASKISQIYYRDEMNDNANENNLIITE